MRDEIERKFCISDRVDITHRNLFHFVTRFELNEMLHYGLPGIFRLSGGTYYLQLLPKFGRILSDHTASYPRTCVNLLCKPFSKELVKLHLPGKTPGLPM
jgi:hypothetical protein